jgi:hypothetical protein
MRMTIIDVKFFPGKISFINDSPVKSRTSGIELVLD